MGCRGVIGLVGGVGPFATVDVLRKIHQIVDAKRDQDYPDVIVISRPGKIPDRTGYLLKGGENPGKVMGDIAAELVELGADVVGVPCGTAHATPIFSEIERKAGGKLVHLIEEIGAYIKTNHPNAKKVGVLCTEGSFKTGVYNTYLEPMGFEIVYPDDMSPVHDAIYNPVYGIKVVGEGTENALEQIEKCAHQLREKGAEVIVLGCTELPLAVSQPRLASVPVIDINHVLASALVRKIC